MKGLFPSEKVEYGASRRKVKRLGELSDLSTIVRGCTTLWVTLLLPCVVPPVGNLMFPQFGSGLGEHHEDQLVAQKQDHHHL